MVALLVSACGSISTFEVPEARMSNTINANATSTVPALGKTDGSLNPVRLIIPTLAINATVEWVGAQSNADLATPTQNPWEDVGWYNLGPHPGERGSAVIDGHLDRPGGSPAVFWSLRNLHMGDAVLVMNTAGRTLRFLVTRIALYTPQAAPIQDIFGNWGGTYLNLITCAGEWIPSQHQTNLRLVVYTSLAKV
jgi:sortase (surface protein transpeptidase)